MRELLGWCCLVLPLGAADSGWLPGLGQAGATTDLSVDRSRRNAVASFWNCVYGASEGAAGVMGWTGSYGSCSAGGTARVFQDAVQRRINFMRAMAGVPAGTLVNEGSTVYVDATYNPPAGTLRSTAAQQAAHMMAKHRNGSGQPVVTHTPSSNFTCFTSAAGNGCYRGSLAYGFCGPAAIDEYLRESDGSGVSIWSTAAGHRRWLLYPGATVFASGDTPGGSGYQPTNVLYCVPPQADLIEVAPGFTAWPAAGYFPDELNTRVWSLSRPGAVFSAATVTMSGPGGAVSVSVLDRTSTGYGDPAIVWQVPVGVGSTAVAADTVYQVTVSGIGGSGVPASHSYSVKLFDPDTLNESQQVLGTAAPPAAGATYGFVPVELAESHEAGVWELLAAGWTEGAEDTPTPRVIDGTGANYSLRAAMSFSGSNFWRTGAKAFRLAFPYFVNPPAEDWFELDRVLVTGAAASLNLHYRRGYSNGMNVLIETSINEGLSWQTAGTINGRTDQITDTGFSSLSVPLPANQAAVRVRMRNDWNGAAFHSVQQYPTQPVGVFLDDLTVTGAGELQELARVPVAAGARTFRVDPAVLGRTPAAGAEFRLRLRATLGQHTYPWGPTKVVQVTANPLGGYEGWAAYEQPLLAGGFEDDDDGDGEGNGVEYAFYGDPLDGRAATGVVEVDRGAGVLRLSRPLAAARSGVVYQAEVSGDLAVWTSVGVVVTIGGGEAVAEVPLAGGARFMRWRVTQG